MRKRLLTQRGYDFYEVASALQKSIRRADTKVAGYFALELFPQYHNYVWKRLLTVSAEDCYGPMITQEVKALHDSFLFVNKGKKGNQIGGRVFISKAVVALFAGSGVFDNKVNLFIGLSKKKIIPAKEVRIPFKKLDFVKSRKIVLPILLLALVGGITYSLITHFNFAVDFTGGTSITINTTDDISLGDYTINKIDRTKDSTNIVINEKLTKEEIEALSNKLEEEYHTTSNIYVVSDMVKKQLIKNAIMAVIISLIGIIIYVSFRFRFNYAISGIVALMHDALITIIFFGVFKLQIDSVFIAAILTIIGYSINDTIVTFDMIRRNYNERKIKNKGNRKV